MTSRDRILTAFNHRESDRIPVDLSGHRSSGISAIAYRKLRQHLGLEPRSIRVYDPIQQLAIVDDDILEMFGVDTIELGRAFALREEDWADWVLPDGTPCKIPVWARPERVGDRWVYRSAQGRIIGQMPAGVHFFEQTYYPFEDGGDVDSLSRAMGEAMWLSVAAPPGPLVSGADGDAVLRAGAQWLRSSTTRAINGSFSGKLLEMGQFLYRNDNFFMLLAGEPEKAHAFLEKITEMHLHRLERYLANVGDVIDVIGFSDDLGMQTGPQVSPKMYREFFKPRHAMMWKRAKELANVRVMLHCCGGIRELLPDLIDAGIDAINPVQISCRGMDPAELKHDFGKDLVFWGGGCDTQAVLLNAAPDDVKRHVLGLLNIFAPGGGFVFQQVHNILADVPPQNIVAMYRAVREWEGR